MDQNINDLIEKFNIIKHQGLHKSLRNGNTGIGYTFESLLGKMEDASFAPDYKGIEIKTKLGYSKCPVTLFSLVPKSSYDKTINQMVEMYGYPDKDYKQYKVLRANANAFQRVPVQNRYIFRLYIDRKEKRLKLLIFNKMNDLINDNIYWDFYDLKERLYTKLSYLALVIGYPYKRDGQIYYKYLTISIYKLKDFSTFVDLIEKGEIDVVFNIGIYKGGDKLGEIYDHGTAFKLSTASLQKLFNIIKR